MVRVIVKLGSRPCPGQLQMTTRSTQTNSLSLLSWSGPRADSIIVKLGSRPCPGQVQMTTRSTQPQPLSLFTKSGPEAWLYNCNATTHPPTHHPPIKLFWVKKWAGKKILRKNLVFTTFFNFWTILSDALVPWSPWVTRYTGGLSQLPVVKMSWGKNSKKKPSVHNIF